jgi:hypothetical protein
MSDKGREFKAVSMLRDANDSSDAFYTQETFNPRLHLIEKSIADKLAEALEQGSCDYMAGTNLCVFDACIRCMALKEYRGRIK